MKFCNLLNITYLERNFDNEKRMDDYHIINFHINISLQKDLQHETKYEKEYIVRI